MRPDDPSLLSENPRPGGATSSGDELGEALRSLPTCRASEGFTDRVLARLDSARPSGADSAAPSRPRPAAFRPSWAAAAAVAAAIALALLFSPGGIRDGSPAGDGGESSRRARLEELRREQQALAAELAALKHRAAPGGAPVLYLGGDETTDLVLDLEGLARRRAATRDPVRPARYEGR